MASILPVHEGISKENIVVSNVELIKNDEIVLGPEEVVCLSGAFPMPNFFIEKKFEGKDHLKFSEFFEVSELTLKELLDVDECIKTYRTLLESSIHLKAQTLIIHANPTSLAYFKSRLDISQMWVMEKYLDNMGVEIKKILEEENKNSSLKILLVLPISQQFYNLSTELSAEERNANFVKDFPVMNFAKKAKKTFYIMHSSSAQQLCSEFQQLYKNCSFQTHIFSTQTHLWKYHIS